MRLRLAVTCIYFRRYSIRLLGHNMDCLARLQTPVLVQCRNSALCYDQPVRVTMRSTCVSDINSS
jgi:hypothetical protein